MKCDRALVDHRRREIILHRSTFERNMDDEIRFHLESRIDDLVRSGLPRHQAARRARIEFGNPEAYQERCRESRRLHFTLVASYLPARRATRVDPRVALRHE